MKYLDSEISSLNQFLMSGISTGRDVFAAGLVITVKDKGGNSNMDKDKNRIHVDDKFDVFFYHRLRDDLFRPSGTGRGLANDYHSEGGIDLIVFSKVPYSDDYFKSKLNEYPGLTLRSASYDQYRILQEESFAKEFDFKGMMIFSINYTINYKLKKCQSL